MIKEFDVRDLELVQDHIGAWYYQLDGRGFTGRAYALFPKTNLRSHEYNLVNGYQNGLQKQWHSNGQILSEQHFSNNIPNGKCSEWHENGVLRFEGEYKMGERIWSKSYNEQGEVIREFPARA